METKVCSKCGIEKEVCEFYKNNKNPNLYRTHCKKCMNENSAKYKFDNKEKLVEKSKEYVKRNSEVIKEKRKIYLEKNPYLYKNWLEKNKEHRHNYIKNYNSNPKIKVKNSLRTRINELMNKKYDNPRTFDLVGCDFEFLLSYIEEKFVGGMNWDNYGYYGWHIDHIIPLSSAKNEEEIRKLYHYTNLQPLWFKDNLKKSNNLLT
jgi:hypothetical protein